MITMGMDDDVVPMKDMCLGNGRRERKHDQDDRGFQGAQHSLQQHIGPIAGLVRFAYRLGTALSRQECGGAEMVIAISR
jgi:hypothetical protein